jgi:hypothetical protein
MSGSGVLMTFEEPLNLAVGDQISADFKISNGADDSLPYWAIGKVVRVQDSGIAVVFKAGGFSPSGAPVAIPIRSPIHPTKPTKA